MAPREQNRFVDLTELAAKLPWWVGVVLAAIAYVILHSMVIREIADVVEPGKSGGMVGAQLGKTFAMVGQYLLPAAFLSGAALSAYGRYTRRALHQQVAASPDRGALNQLSWRQFEALVGEAFRRKGYSVTVTGGGADGGADLKLKKAGEIFLVQCKQWRATRVGMNIVRELDGVMTARGAAGGFVVTSGIFTDEACAFARGKNIELIDGKALRALICGVSAPVKFFRDPLSIMTTGAPYCPECQSRMKMRKARHGAPAGTKYWRCSRHPDCKGMRPA